MTVTWLTAYQRRSHVIEKIFLVFNLALFAYAFADWRGWLPFQRGFQPLQVVLLAGALVLQSLAPWRNAGQCFCGSRCSPRRSHCLR